MARFASLFSSSTGNCTYIGSPSHGILVDVGMSTKQTLLQLESRGIDPSTIDGIFITHEHSDHVKGLKVFASKFQIPVYMTQGTMDELERHDILSDKYDAFVIPDDGVDLGDIHIKAFRTPHDSAESCGYTATFSDGRVLSVATDMGEMTYDVMQALKGSDLVLIESNHDVGMLRNGPYPYPLKRRILSSTGHLSNEACSEAIKTLVENGTTRFVLGHLSKENNYPPLAYETSKAALTQIGATEGVDYLLEVAAPIGKGMSIL